MTAKYRIEDLRQTGALEFRAEGTGNFFINRNGRRVEETVGVNYVPTKVGKFPDTKWHQLIEEAVKRENEQDLLEKIEIVCGRFAWLKTDKERHEYALEILVNEAYSHWPEWNDSFTSVIRLNEEEESDSGGDKAVQGKTAKVQEADSAVHEL